MGSVHTIMYILIIITHSGQLTARHYMYKFVGVNSRNLGVHAKVTVVYFRLWPVSYAHIPRMEHAYSLHA